MKQLGWRSVLLIPSLIIATTSEMFAFNTDTHRELNRRAADVSSLDSYLKQQLRLAAGLAERVNERELRQWMEEGGAAEDRFFGNEVTGAAFRSIHHFHNPLLPWGRAGLDALSICPPFFLQGEASVRWAQDPNQGISGKAAWGDARKKFHAGLTLPSKTERDDAFAGTFQVLGQQMHLIADLAVPAHARNDPHCPVGDGFEKWASRVDVQPLLQGLLAGEPVRPDAAIFSVGVPLQDDIARVPVARLWDTDQYDGTNPDVTLGSTIGLAEYTNANFFSGDTVFGLEFPFPAPTSVELGPPQPQPKNGELRRYFMKVRDGEFVGHLAVPSALYDFLPDALKDREKGLDDNVFEEYASLLLPRVVGYSAALLDYFFRGSLEARLTDARLDDTGFHRALRITNRTPGEAMSGTLHVYYDTAQGERVDLASWSITLDPEGSSDLPPIPPSLANKPPAERGRYLLVFRGSLGEEPDAVVAQWVTVWVGFLRTVWETYACVRPFGSPTEYECDIVDGATGQLVLPDADGVAHFTGDAFTRHSFSKTYVPNPYYPSGLYLYSEAGVIQKLYLYLEGPGPVLHVTATVSATVPAPSGWAACDVFWGTLAGGIQALTSATYDSPPYLAQFRGVGGLFGGPSTFTFAVGPGPLLVEFGVPTGTYPTPQLGTISWSGTCDLASLKFAAE